MYYLSQVYDLKNLIPQWLTDRFNASESNVGDSTNDSELNALYADAELMPKIP